MFGFMIVNCGSTFEPGASGLPYYCTSICVRFGCTRRAGCVDSKKKKMWRITRFPLSLCYKYDDDAGGVNNFPGSGT